MVLKGMNSILCWLILSYPLRGCGWLSTVCDTVVLCVGTQSASPLEVLLDDSKNGCVSDPDPALYTYWWSFPGPTKKMKVAVKGGAAVDPESGTSASVEFLRKQCRNSFKPLFHWTPLCRSSFVLWTDLIVNFVCFIVFSSSPVRYCKSCGITERCSSFYHRSAVSDSSAHAPCTAE